MDNKFNLSDAEEELKLLKARIVELELENEQLRQQYEQDSYTKTEKELIDLIFKSTPVSVGISRMATGEFLYANEHCAKLLRTTVSALIGRSSTEFYADLTQRKHLVEKFKREGSLSNEEVRFRRVDGTPYWCLITWRHINFNNEECILFWAYDVDPLKKAEAALHHAIEEMETLYTINSQLIEAKNLTELVSALVERIPIPVINRAIVLVMNYEGKKADSLTVLTNWYRGDGQPPTTVGTNYVIDETSRFLQFLMGKEPVFFEDMQDDTRVDEITYQYAVQLNIHALCIFPLIIRDQHFGVLILQGDRPYAFPEKELRLYQSMIGQLAASIENRFLFEQMEQKVAERTAELLSINLQLQQEVGERKKAETALKSYTIELERSNRELQDFAYLSSHDLQEPLRKIQAFSDRLQLKYVDALDEKGLDYLARIQNAANRMQKLIEALLIFSRVTSQAKPFSHVNLNKVIHGVLEDLEFQIESQNAKISIAELPTIEADKFQMRQLFQNLISNSLKYHQPDEPPEIKIEAKLSEDVPEGYCQIIVSDKGIGFEEQHNERIFQVFQRLYNREAYDGTGVGLAVCRRIVERHQGSVSAHGKLGEGATFVVELPIHQS